ncbi:MAG: hypothetical protein JXL84_19470, partial [Deltaproteobacteria bacterium]|nr:hypothetical protein [Deltaproteobacteria bacterium]
VVRADIHARRFVLPLATVTFLNDYIAWHYNTSIIKGLIGFKYTAWSKIELACCTPFLSKICP